MTNSEIEKHLRRYRPVGPPPALRARVVGGSARRSWPWALAAAALLVVTVGLPATTGAMADELNAAVRPAPVAAAAAAVVDGLADDVASRWELGLMAMEQRVREITDDDVNDAAPSAGGGK